MSGDEPSYKSRLQPPGPPMRGIGAAYPQNQRLVGAADPEEAARLARLSPEEAQLEQSRLERLKADLDAMREDLLLAVNQGQWCPPELAGKSSADVKDLLDRTPAGQVQVWHREMNEAVEKAIDTDSAQQLAETLQSELQVGPDDPLYDPLTDKRRRKAIEETLTPMDFETLVFQGSCTQDIPLRQGFTITFRTVSTQHGLWLEYYMSQQPETSYQHTRHFFSLLQVAASLDAINGKGWSDLSKYIRADQRDEYIKAIEQRMERLGQLPSALADDLIVQYVWFSGRVRKMLAGDLMRKVGNS